MRIPVILLLVGAFLALPSSVAHIEAFSQAKLVSIGPYNAAVEPKPSPIFANGALSMTALFSDNEKGQYVTKGIEPSIEVVDATANRTTTPMQLDATGYYVAAVAFDRPGNYTVSLVVKDAKGTYSNGSVFTVYPDLPLRFRSEDPRQPDPIVNESYTITIDSLDPDTGLPTDKGLTDLTLTLEHWSLDHSTIYFSDAYPMQHPGSGRWTLQHSFPLEGMYHLRFSSASGGFKNDDVPILHVNALPPPPGTGAHKTPLPPGALLLALAAGALLARRR